MTWLDWLEEHMEQVYRMCRKIAGLRRDLIDDLYGECVDRLPAVYDRWDGDRPLDTWIYASLKWYAYKRRCRLVAEYIDRPVRHSQSTDVLDSFEYLVSRMSKEDLDLLWARCVDGMTNDEAGEWFGWSRESTRCRYNTAMRTARRILASEFPDG